MTEINFVFAGALAVAHSLLHYFPVVICFFFPFLLSFFFFHVSSLSIFFLLEIGIRAAPLSRDSRSDLAERGQLRGEMWRTT
jgi:hypothetical protein